MRAYAIAALLCLGIVAHAQAGTGRCPPGKEPVALSSSYTDRSVTSGTLEQGGGNTFAKVVHTYYLPKKIAPETCVPSKNYILEVGSRFVERFNDGDYIFAINIFQEMLYLYSDEKNFRPFIFELEKLQYGHILAASYNIQKETERDYSLEIASNRMAFDHAFGDTTTVDQFILSSKEYQASTTVIPKNKIVAITLHLAAASYGDRVRRKYADLANDDSKDFFAAVAESVKWANNLSRELDTPRAPEPAARDRKR